MTCCSTAKSCLILWYPMNCSMPGFLVLIYLLEFAQTCIQWVSDAIQPSHPLWLPSLLPSIFPSIRVFSKQLALCIRCPKYWSFNFSISLSREYSGLISFGTDWFDILASKGTLKSVVQHQFFGAQPFLQYDFHIYMTTGTTIALTIQTFVGKKWCLCLSIHYACYFFYVTNPVTIATAMYHWTLALIRCYTGFYTQSN